MNVITPFPAREFDRGQRFQLMFQGAAIGIGICQLDGRIVEANPALSRILGYSQQELTGKYAGELFPEPDRRPYSASSPPDEPLLAELMRGERGCFEIEKLYRRKDGSEFWGHLTASLGRDERRQPAFLVALLADATEPRRMGELLLEAEKMELIGRLAGGIVHDFNNLLTGILLYCDLLSARLECCDLPDCRLASSRLERSELRQHVAEVRRASEHGAALTRQLLAVARRQAAEPRPVPINEIVTSSENLLRRLIGEHIELVVVLDPTLDSGAGLVVADPAQLRQILLNLVLNARDAMPRGGKIRLITRTAELPGAQFPREVGPGRTRRAVSLTVQDNGSGMDGETRRRLFEPFFTTKNPGEGTGLGLATVERIVGAANGRIEVDSEPGRGTSIEVFLPAIELTSEESPRLNTDSS